MAVILVHLLNQDMTAFSETGQLDCSWIKRSQYHQVQTKTNRPSALCNKKFMRLFWTRQTQSPQRKQSGESKQRLIGPGDHDKKADGG